MSEYNIANTIMGQGTVQPPMDSMAMAQDPSMMQPQMGQSPAMPMQPPQPQVPMGMPFMPKDPVTEGPYPDVFKFMNTAQGKKITRAAIDAAIRAMTEHGTDVQTKDITDTIIRTARQQS